MLESKPSSHVVTGSVRLVHAVGMHARPAVKLTKLAKKFDAEISIRPSEAAEWVNAKSIAKVMAMRAKRDSTIEIMASGPMPRLQWKPWSGSLPPIFRMTISEYAGGRRTPGVQGQNRVDRFRPRTLYTP